jgi:hypothetical protein
VDLEYCFVTGCPRSGTTGLTRLLHAHDNVVIGMERYRQLTRTKALSGFTPALFEPARFFDFRPGDTDIDPEHNERFRQHYEDAHRRMTTGDVRYIGDKLLPNAKILAAAIKYFPSPKFIFIYRDLLRVASSWAVRAQKRTDVLQGDAAIEHAFTVWRDAFDVIADVIDRLGPDRVFVVRYERLFGGDAGVCAAMFHFLGLDVSAPVMRTLRGSASSRPAHDANPIALTPDTQASLLARRDPRVEARFDAMLDDEVAAYEDARRAER